MSQNTNKDQTSNNPTSTTTNAETTAQTENQVLGYF